MHKYCYTRVQKEKLSYSSLGKTVINKFKSLTVVKLESPTGIIGKL